MIYDRTRTWPDTFLRILLFKIFNRIETWELIQAHIGEINAGSFDSRRIASLLGAVLRARGALYSAAYIMPSAMTFGSSRKHVNHLRLLTNMLRDNTHQDVVAARSFEDVFDILVHKPSIGPFLAYQFAIDLNYTAQLSFSESEFVMPGPGALDGISKCFSDLGDYSPRDVIRWTMEVQESQFERRGIEFEDLWTRRLQLIDCQNLFCEVGKYARVVHPEFAGASGRTRIKQRFSPRQEPITAWYPPKWGLNTRIQAWMARST